MILLLSGESEFFGINLFDGETFFNLALRFLFSTFVIFTLIRYLYYPIARRKDYFFAYMLVGSIVFMLSFTLLRVPELGIGVALGLFALFGILRFRTIGIPIKEMTYLFLVIGISVINAMAGSETSLAELLFINVVFLIITWVGERLWLLRIESTRTIIYQDLELIKPENRIRLQADLEDKTGLKIKRIQIGRVDLVKKCARIKIYYRVDENAGFYEDEELDKEFE